MEAYASSILSLFAVPPQHWWLGGTPGKVGDDLSNRYILVAIQEDENWWQNKCVLRDWYFNYTKCKELGLEVDCMNYGVYIFCLK